MTNDVLVLYIHLLQCVTIGQHIAPAQNVRTIRGGARIASQTLSGEERRDELRKVAIYYIAFSDEQPKMLFATSMDPNSHSLSQIITFKSIGQEFCALIGTVLWNPINN